MGLTGPPCPAVERYNPQENRWHTIAPMGTRRKHLGCAVYQDMIYAVGGRDDTTELSSAERYNPRTNQWSPVVAMTSRRSGVSGSSGELRTKQDRSGLCGRRALTPSTEYIGTGRGCTAEANNPKSLLGDFSRNRSKGSFLSSLCFGPIGWPGSGEWTAHGCRRLRWHHILEDH